MWRWAKGGGMGTSMIVLTIKIKLKRGIWDQLEGAFIDQKWEFLSIIKNKDSNGNISKKKEKL